MGFMHTHTLLFRSYTLTTGRLLHCQVEHHVQDNFATPILYGIDNFKFDDIFSTYTEPLTTSFVYFLDFLPYSFLILIVLDQLCVILVRNGMFY